MIGWAAGLQGLRAEDEAPAAGALVASAATVPGESATGERDA